MRKWLKNEKLRRYLSMEIGIEYKACLYFFVVLFFYCMYLLLHGVYEARLLHMFEMIAATYGMGYFQVLVLGNFDETERLSGRQFLYMLLCSVMYAGISYLCGWFDRELMTTAVFALFCVAAYFCAYLVNRAKRDIDTEQLNVMLQAYQKGGRRDECHRNEGTDEALR